MPDYYHGSAPHARGTRYSNIQGRYKRRFSPACAGNAADNPIFPLRYAVQPRMRGERLRVSLALLRIHGSAPHARGTHVAVLELRLRRRFSPACAGNARYARKARRPWSVQPRMRGERLDSGRLFDCCFGSAPHARGTHCRTARGVRLSRFSPACAGNAKPASMPAFFLAVQPRMRGERRALRVWCAVARGSAPHARGTHQDAVDDRCPGRFSPACAGNAGARSRDSRLRTVQPRMRGERPVRTAGIRIKGGSAPHARGTPGREWSNRNSSRFSPACAGNAFDSTGGRCTVTVQPRMRGERANLERHLSEDGGSAPHARGTRRRGSCRYCRTRFSPACAGNASSATGFRRRGTVQPRMRGERPVISRTCRRDSGSAPHARGTPRTPAPIAPQTRFSPACAGNAYRARPRSR